MVKHVVTFRFTGSAETRLAVALTMGFIFNAEEGKGGTNYS